jgi:hypothetical protein
MKTISTRLKGIAAGLAFAGAATAQELPPIPDSGLVELSAEDMAMLAAGDGEETVFVITDQTLNATNFGNTVIGETIISGDVSLAANAFSGYSGLGNFVINTGHNNNLQSTMSVSVALPPSGGPQ